MQFLEIPFGIILYPLDLREIFFSFLKMERWVSQAERHGWIESFIPDPYVQNQEQEPMEVHGAV